MSHHVGCDSLLLEDYVIAGSAGVIAASVVILGSLLPRYSKLMREADKSTRLAKDVWDSVSSRFSVVDGRIIDLMAKTEVLSSRVGGSFPSYQQATPSKLPSNINETSTKAGITTTGTHVARVELEGTETEARVLRFLADGPKSSAQIKDEVGRSREHTARLMKALFDRGLVMRNARNKPYVYEITDSGKSYGVS